MSDTVTATTQIPAYASYVSFRNFLDWLKEMDHVPEQIDRSLWGTKFNGATGSALMSSCRFLGLLVEERPTPRLHEMVAADNTTRKRLIEQMVRTSYGDDVVDRLPGMTPKLLDDHLKNLGATDATLRKAASFFINALKATDVSVPAAIAKKARNRRPGARRRGGGQKETADPAGEAGELPAPEAAPVFEGNNLRTIRLGEGVEADLRVRGDILTLPNRLQVLAWLQSVLEQFDKGQAELDESEEFEET